MKSTALIATIAVLAAAGSTTLLAADRDTARNARATGYNHRMQVVANHAAEGTRPWLALFHRSAGAPRRGHQPRRRLLPEPRQGPALGGGHAGCHLRNRGQPAQQGWCPRRAPVGLIFLNANRGQARPNPKARRPMGWSSASMGELKMACEHTASSMAKT